MKVLLDTDICIFVIKQKPPEVLERFKTFEVGDIAVSSVTAAELMYGAQKSQKVEQNQRAVEQFLLPLMVIPFDYEAAIVYGKVRAELERKGTPIGSLDTMIAAHALQLGLALVTNNTREYSRLEGLTVYNWVSPEAG